MEKISSIARTQIAARRWKSLVAVGLIGVVSFVCLKVLEENMYRTAFVSGYVLFVAIGFLAAFNVRKKLSFLPILGDAASWMQLHIYVGLLTGGIFGMHIGWRIPNGAFESTLAVVFLGTFTSGLYGLAISRIFPRKLAGLRTQVIFEQIPELRNRLSQAANELITRMQSNNDTLQRFFFNRVSSFLHQPRSMAFVVSPSNRECRKLVHEILAMDRYLSTEDREVSRKLMQLVRDKDDLDYHWALQSRLKYWLFVHIGLTYSLLVLATFHLLLAHAFAGGLK